MPSSATFALIWIMRNLMFLHHFLRTYVESECSIKECLRVSYENTLMKNHEQTIRNVFAVSVLVFLFFLLFDRITVRWKDGLIWCNIVTMFLVTIKPIIKSKINKSYRYLQSKCKANFLKSPTVYNFVRFVQLVQHSQLNEFSKIIDSWTFQKNSLQ